MRDFAFSTLLALGITACSVAPAVVGETPAVGPTATPIPAATGASPAVTFAPTPTPEPPVEEVAILDHGFSTFKGKYDSGKSLSWGVVLENQNTAALLENIDVNITFTDDSGTVIDSVSDTVTVIPPNQRVGLGDTISYFGNSDLGDVTKMEVQAIADTSESFTVAAGTFSFSGTRLTRDSLGDLVVKTKIKSTFAKELETVYVVALFLRDGKIVGGAWTFADRLPAGGSASVSVDGPELRNIDSANLYARLSGLSILGD